jgi:MFS family permease
VRDESTLQREGRERWLALALMAATLILAMSTWFSASAVLPELRSLWNLSPGISAWLTIAVQIGFVCGAVVSSLLNLPDIVAPRHVILGGAVGAAAANALVQIAGGPAVGIPLRFATGFFLAAVYPPAFKLMSTWFRGGRGLALGVLAAAIVVGNGMPHLVNGLGGLDWRLVIYATSALTVAGGLIAEFGVKPGPYPFPKAVFDPRQAGRVFANRGVRLAALGYVGHMWELFAVYAWFSAFFADALRARGVTVGSNAAYATFAMFVAGGLGCWLLYRRGRFGPVLDHGHRVRRSGLRRHGVDPAIGGRFYRDSGHHLADPAPARGPRLEMGVCRPGAGADPGRGVDAPAQAGAQGQRGTL